MSAYIDEIIACATDNGAVNCMGMPKDCHDWQGADSLLTPLGKAMHDIWCLVDPHNPQPVPPGDSTKKLEVLRGFLGVEAQQFQAQFDEWVHVCLVRAAGETAAAGPFKEAVKDAANWGILDVSTENRGHWGSKSQYLFGKIVVRELQKAGLVKNADMHGCWGVFLLPCGGMAGAGNAVLTVRDTAQPVIIHSIVHDAFGYILSYHNIGGGYNYLQTKFTLSDTTSPLSCQYAGVTYVRYQKFVSGKYRWGDIWCGQCRDYDHSGRGVVVPCVVAHQPNALDTAEYVPTTPTA